MVSTPATRELYALCNSQSASNLLSFQPHMTDWRWEFQQKEKQLGFGVLQKPYILHLTTLIFASFYPVRGISDLAWAELLEMNPDNDPAGSPVRPRKLCYKM